MNHALIASRYEIFVLAGIGVLEVFCNLLASMEAA